MAPFVFHFRIPCPFPHRYAAHDFLRRTAESSRCTFPPPPPPLTSAFRRLGSRLRCCCSKKRDRLCCCLAIVSLVCDLVIALSVLPLGFLSAPHPLCASLFFIRLQLDDSLFFFAGSADSGLGLSQVFCYCSGGIATLVSVVWSSCAYGRTHALRHHPLSPLPPSAPEYEHSSPPRLAHFEHTVSLVLPFPA